MLLHLGVPFLAATCFCIFCLNLIFPRISSVAPKRPCGFDAAGPEGL